MIEFSKKDLQKLDHIYKINLINSCSGYKSANLIGTKSKAGVENLAVFSSITHLGSSPALLGFFCRPTTVPRHTYKNIIETHFYTLNAIYNPIIKQAHHTSAKYPESVSEFDTTTLLPEYKLNYNVPFVSKAPLQILMKYVNQYHIKENDTILVIGCIEKLFIKDKLLQNDGFIDLSKGNIATINGLDNYSIPKTKKRFSYQRPKPLT